MERKSTNRLVKEFGARLQQDLAVENRLPIKIALMIEHLRRAEDEMKTATSPTNSGQTCTEACREPG